MREFPLPVLAATISHLGKPLPHPSLGIKMRSYFSNYADKIMLIIVGCQTHTTLCYTKYSLDISRSRIPLACFWRPRDWTGHENDVKSEFKCRFSWVCSSHSSWRVHHITLGQRRATQNCVPNYERNSLRKAKVTSLVQYILKIP